MEKPQILIIENSIGITGALKAIVGSSDQLRDSFDFHFIVPKSAAIRSTIELSGFFSIFEVPMKELNRRPLSWFQYLPYLLINSIRIARIIKKKHISLVHSNDLYNLLPIVTKLWRPHVPYISHVRFLPNRFPTALFNFWIHIHLKFAVSIVAVSESVLKMLPKDAKFVLIYDSPPAVENHPIKPIKNSNLVFLYLSNWIMGKGQNLALESFAKIHHDLPGWILRFVGGDMGLPKNKNYREEQMKRAESLGIKKKIECLEFTDDVEVAYKHADIVLNFSESESFSITCLEALFYGRPVIASDCGGPREIIDNDITGIVVQNGNVVAMAESMKKLANNDFIRTEMGFNGREAVRRKFNQQNTTLRLKEVYEKVLRK